MTLSQREVELTMYRAGISRATAMMHNAEEHGEAARNPYAATLYRDYVLQLADVIRADIKATKPGRYHGHIALLAPLEADAVALLAVRSVINSLMHPTKGSPTLRQAAVSIGVSVHQELVLAQIEHLNPELYHTLVMDFNRRRSKNVRHRLTVFKMQAAKAGIEWAEWGPTDRDCVGMYLIDSLARLGMVDIDPPPTRADGSRMSGKMANPLEVRLTPAVVETISRIKGFVSITSPVYGPCVEPPLDWHSFSGGGFHTDEMRRTHPYLVKAHATARERLRDHVMPVVYQAVNALQKTAWRVNSRLLAAIQEVARYRSVGEIETNMDAPRPPPPQWLAEEGDARDRTEAQEAEFRRWKRAMSQWYTERKLRTAKVSRFLAAIRAAEMFRAQPNLYFVYFADSRGRLYPLTYGVNPQGSDMQKALLHFAQGLPLHTPDAIKWFLIQGANKWGFDKAPLVERAAWHLERQQLLLSFADNPLDNRGWEEAGDPLQFLAWCFEYADWIKDPANFVSHLPISMDGSCNGLQHFSAMLRDEVGGRATNLTDNVQMQDIYKLVATRATELLQQRLAAGDDPDRLVSRWLSHGVERSLVKRAVMTTPYGVTKRTAVSYAVEDYLRVGKAPVFEQAEYFTAAQVVMDAAWEAIGDVVIKSRAAMDWLRAAASKIIKARGDSTEGVLSWETPSGFLATQSYYELEEHRVRTRLHGSTRILVVSEADEASPKRHASGLAPNFVHSMDASHLHLVAAAAGSTGTDALAMIHDDYGTHAANAQKLYTLIRVQFLQMYTDHDPIAEFAALYPESGQAPGKGDLDLGEVIYSDYFFS